MHKESERGFWKSESGISLDMRDPMIDHACLLLEFETLHMRDARNTVQRISYDEMEKIKALRANIMMCSGGH